MINIISAVAKNNIIGVKNDLPWKLQADLKYFSKTTTGKTVVMGKNTFNSIFKRLGKPLPHRRNVIISFVVETIPGCEVYTDLKSFLEENKNDDLFIIGGASIYKQTIDMADRLYITEVDSSPDGDVYFPEIKSGEWTLVSEDQHQKDENNDFDYNFKIYDHKK
jgi:dihydrofolate reductase